MDKIRHYLARVLLNSPFGVTLLTMSAMALMFGFLVIGTHPVPLPVDSDDEELVATNLQPDGSAGRAPADRLSADRVNPSERYASNRANSSTRAAPRYVARLMRTQDCRWATDADAPRDGAPLKVGQTLRVTTGLAEIAFACGAKAILEGPAVLELQSEKSGALRTGRLTADVPDEVEGFTVHTPVAQVVSLCAIESKPVARLTSTADCHWADDSAVTKEGVGLKPGQKVKLINGLAQITFACGAKVILQGPGVLEIESLKTAILHSGKLTADVPDDLEGFKIRTPVAEVIALPVDAKTAKPTAGKLDTEPGVVILRSGEHAQIEVPVKEAPGKKVQPSSKTSTKS